MQFQLGIGTYRLRGEAVSAPMRHALAHSTGAYRTIDTAEGYRNGTEIARALRSAGISRPQVRIVSKLGPPSMGDAASPAIERLFNDFNGLLPLDLILIHWPAASGRPPEHSQHSVDRLKTWRALEACVANGKIAKIGVSNYTLRHLQELWSVATVKPAELQIELHPLVWHNQREIVLWCNNHGISITAYSSFGEGELLSTDSHLPELEAISSRHNKTRAQVLLRWALQHGFKVIPKASSPTHIDENAGCLGWELDSEAMSVLDSVSDDPSRRKKFCWDPTVVA